MWNLASEDSIMGRAPRFGVKINNISDFSLCTFLAFTSFFITLPPRDGIEEVLGFLG